MLSVFDIRFVEDRQFYYPIIQTRIIYSSIFCKFADTN